MAIEPTYDRPREESQDPSLKSSVQLGVGALSCLTSLYAFFRATPHLSTAYENAGSLDYFFSIRNWIYLGKTGITLYKCGFVAAVALEQLLQDPRNYFQSSTAQENYARVCIADALMKAFPWLTLSVSTSIAGIHLIRKSLQKSAKVPMAQWVSPMPWVRCMVL